MLKLSEVCSLPTEWQFSLMLMLAKNKTVRWFPSELTIDTWCEWAFNCTEQLEMPNHGKSVNPALFESVFFKTHKCPAVTCSPGNEKEGTGKQGHLSASKPQVLGKSHSSNICHKAEHWAQWGLPYWMMHWGSHVANCLGKGSVNWALVP